MEAIVIKRIRDLWWFRQLCRRNRWGYQRDNDIELRALVRLARQWRDAPDPMTQAKAEADRAESWTLS